MTDDTQRGDHSEEAFLPGVNRVARQQEADCAAPGCTNPGGAFTLERDDQIYEFCSEACRAAFEHPTG